MNIGWGIIKESGVLFQTMAPYLLFGFLFAGILKVFIPQDKILSFLGRGKIRSSLYASLIGIPIPLCSCGVIPAAASLRKQGADKGATLSFLISTPTTGIDSILATYALLGPVFTAFRVISSFVTAVICGIITNLFFPDKERNISCVNNSCSICSRIEPHTHSIMDKLKYIFSYAFVELMEDTGKWLVIGIILGGIITYSIPDNFIYRYLGSNWTSMFIMLLIGIPIYICATGSIPIVAALMLKGMSPGAGLVFLIAGPATNTVTITVIAKELGKKEVGLYLVIISIAAILSGMILNIIWPHYNNTIFSPSKETIPLWISIGSSILLGCLLLYSSIKNMLGLNHPHIETTGEEFVLRIPDMDCQHCVNTIKGALKELHIDNAVVDLKNKRILLEPRFFEKREQIVNALVSAGFTPHIED